MSSPQHSRSASLAAKALALGLSSPLHSFAHQWPLSRSPGSCYSCASRLKPGGVCCSSLAPMPHLPRSHCCFPLYRHPLRVNGCRPISALCSSLFHSHRRGFLVRSPYLVCNFLECRNLVLPRFSFCLVVGTGLST